MFRENINFPGRMKMYRCGMNLKKWRICHYPRKRYNKINNERQRGGGGRQQTKKKDQKEAKWEIQGYRRRKENKEEEKVSFACCLISKIYESRSVRGLEMAVEGDDRVKRVVGSWHSRAWPTAWVCGLSFIN